MTALSGTGQATLTWNASAGAASYKVKRSPTSGSNYVTIATGVESTSYSDFSVTNGTTYHYVISAVNTAGESPNSLQASVMPAALVAVSSPWAKVDVGTVGTTGTSYYAGENTFVVQGAGSDINGRADSFQFLYGSTTSTSFSVAARVTTPPSASNKVGVMIRWDATAAGTGSRMVAVILEPNGTGYQARLAYRIATGGTTTWSSPATSVPSIPQWVRLTRAGTGSNTRYTGEISSDNSTWTQVGTVTNGNITGPTFYAGLVVCSRNTTSLAMETFDNVSLPGWTPPPDAPDGLVASTASQTQLNLAWNAVSGATGYQLLRADSWSGTYAQVATSVSATATDSGLSAGTAYYYMVRATKSSGTSGNSLVTTATTLLNIPSITSGSNATWISGIGFSYQITASNTPTNFGATNLPDGLGVNTGTGLISGTPTATGTFNATISAINLGGTGSATLAINVLPQPPAAPSGLTATAGNAQVALAWSAPVGATGYSVKRSTVSGSNYTVIVPNTAATSYTDTGVANWTTYFYVISANNAGGDGLNSIQVTAQPQSPPFSETEISSSSKIGISGSAATLSFKASAIGHSYQLQTIDSLTSGTWTNYGPAQPGTGSDLIFTSPYDAAVPRRFNRLQIRQ